VRGSIVLLDIVGTKCIKPIYHYVRAAAELGAVGVVFIAENDKETTLHADTPPTPINIPTFQVTKTVGEQFNFVNNYRRWSGVSLRLPPIAAGSAAAKLGVDTTTPIMDDDADIVGPADDRSEERDKTKITPGRNTTTIVPADETGLAVGAVIACLIFLGVGFYLGMVFLRRRKRRQLHAFGRMQGTPISTQTLQGAGSNSGAGGGGNMSGGFDMTPIGPVGGTTITARPWEEKVAGVSDAVTVKNGVADAAV
jgi:hypothetical protein